MIKNESKTLNKINMYLTGVLASLTTNASLSKTYIFVPLILSILAITGCSKFQYISVSSYLHQNDTKEFIFENDSVMMHYSFAGQDFPLSITFLNKLEQPLYFDIERSPVYVNDYMISMPFDFDGQVREIAPLSQVTIISNPLSNKLIDLSPRDLQRVKMPESFPAERYSYDDLTSPVYIRCVLALSGKEDLSDPVFYDNSFWISDIIESTTGPESLPFTPTYQFYLKKTTGFGKTLNVAALISLLIISGTLDNLMVE